jgi:hypothetical protein
MFSTEQPGVSTDECGFIKRKEAKHQAARKKAAVIN